MTAKDNFNSLRDLAISSGATLFGVGRIEPSEALSHISREIAPDMTYVISIGIRLSDRVLKGIVDHPTLLYLHHYRTINYLLDHIALKITNGVQERGFNALPIPASQIIDWNKQLGHLSHKMTARLAGHGWIGRNNLLVNPEYGSAVRYTTILTDMPLKTNKPIEADCNGCTDCLDVCPVKSIKESYKEFDRNACLAQLKDFSRRYNIGQHICGICIKACRGKREWAR